MKVVGYTDRLSIQQGESIRVMVSCETPNYRADIVRLIHTDDNPRGPGFKEEFVETSMNGEYRGRKQNLKNGSYVTIPDCPELDLQSLTMQAWIYPTTPRKDLQGIMTKWSSSENTGYGLFISEDGKLSLLLGAGGAVVDRISTNIPLRSANWYFVAASYDAGKRLFSLYQEQLAICLPKNSRGIAEKHSEVQKIGENKVPFLIAGFVEKMESGNPAVGGHFNGKIDSPKLFSRALTHEEVESLKRGELSEPLAEALVGNWDFSIGVSSSKITDTSKNQIHGLAINMPTRAVTGYNWTGQEVKFTNAPEEYGAIHFHDDDLTDAGWDVDLEFGVPSDLKSGVYAVRLKSGDDEDYVPFFVRPKRGTASAPVAFLVPTLSYLAYANEHTMTLPDVANAVRDGIRANYPSAQQDKYIVEHRLLSLYDRHSDGSGVCYSSKLRPLMNMRPKYNSPFLPGERGGPHQFNADMHIVNWLVTKGYVFDVITDEDLHHEGLSIISPYKVIITGSHPEYWTEAMLRAMEMYLNGGGRLMYLGGNGFYWVTSIDQERSHAIEIRRWGGSGTWRTAPGENYHSTSGEIGGIWRNRGRSPNKLVGVGWTAQGLDRCLPYRREPGSFDPRVAFIFEGIDKDAPIGDFESLDMVHGAGGFEIDRLDYTTGSPHHTLVLATATGYSHAYQRTVDEVILANSKQGGPDDPLVRSDMVYLEYPSGGAAFSVSSIGWCGCLSYNGYDNNVSRITENVVQGFLSRSNEE